MAADSSAGLGESPLVLACSSATEKAYPQSLASACHAASSLAGTLRQVDKPQFFDRDLINFEAIHRARGLAVGIVMTRGPRLQDTLRKRGLKKFGARSAHWEKLMQRLDLGRGGATPVVALGLEVDRVRK